MKLSLVIPFFNEELRIPKCIEQLEQFYLLEPDLEVILVDDGSSDQSLEMIQKAKEETQLPIQIVSYQPNRGKGFAIKKGVEQANGDYVLFSDIDFSTPLQEVFRFLDVFRQKELEHAVMIGSRVHLESAVVKQSFLRQFMGKCFNFMMRSVFNVPFKDTQCGFKLFDQVTAKSLFSDLKTDGFSFDVEIIFLAMQRKIHIEELPVKWVNDINSKVSIFYHPFHMLWELYKMRLRLKR